MLHLAQAPTTSSTESAQEGQENSEIKDSNEDGQRIIEHPKAGAALGDDGSAHLSQPPLVPPPIRSKARPVTPGQKMGSEKNIVHARPAISSKPRGTEGTTTSPKSWLGFSNVVDIEATRVSPPCLPPRLRETYLVGTPLSRDFLYEMTATISSCNLRSEQSVRGSLSLRSRASMLV